MQWYAKIRGINLKKSRLWKLRSTRKTLVTGAYTTYPKTSYFWRYLTFYRCKDSQNYLQRFPYFIFYFIERI